MMLRDAISGCLFALLIGAKVVLFAPAPPPHHELGVPSPIVRLERTGFTVLYDQRLRQPAATIEYLDHRTIGGHNPRPDVFGTDRDISEPWRIAPDDYRGSGFDRGHVAAAGNYKGNVEGARQSMLMSNISPQRATMNRGPWKAVESHIRERVTEAGCKAWIVTAPLWLPDSKGECLTRFVHGEIPVPSHFGKAVVIEKYGELEAAAWIVPNVDKAPAVDAADFYRVSVDSFESAGGLDCFALLDDADEVRLEAER